MLSISDRIKKILTSTGNWWRHFLDNCKGVAAIEFAIILPIMLVIVIGTFELSRAITVDRRFDNAAAATADLITRLDTIDNSEFDGIMEIIEEIMNPYTATPLRLTASNVIVSLTNPDNTVVCWSISYNEGVEDYEEGDRFQLPTGMISNGETVVVVEAEYLYTPPLFSMFIKGVIPFKETIYLKPRTSSQIRFDNEICPAPTAPTE